MAHALRSFHMASVYKKRKTWYIRFKDAAGEWRAKASQAQTKTEAKRLALEAAAKAEKEGWGFLDTRQSQDGHQSLEAMLHWWLETYSQGTPSQSIDYCFVAKHFFGTSFAALPLGGVTSSAIEKFLQSKSQALGPSSINHLRGYLSRAINKGIKAGFFFGANPVTQVMKRRVPREMQDYLKEHEVLPVLRHVADRWLPLFATAIYTGLRKGELLGLQVRDIDLQNRLLTITRSYGRNTTKNGRGAVIPIASELVTYLAEAIRRTPSHLVFPNEDGTMLSRHTPLEEVLRRALAHAGIVENYEHVCRRKGCDFSTKANDAELRRCPKDRSKLWPKAVVRKIRFHDLRHTTASLLMMNGANPAAVQRILRHSDPKITTEVYGHLSPGYLRAEADKLSFNPPEADPSEEWRHEEVAQAVNAIPFVTHLLPGYQTVETALAGKQQETG
ncbi:MAG: site-specific integrase, partial [Cytophagaceae bacterium]